MKSLLPVLLILMNLANYCSQGQIIWKNLTLAEPLTRKLIFGLDNQIALETNNSDTTVFIATADANISKRKGNRYFNINVNYNFQGKEILLLACKMEKRDTVILDSAIYQIDKINSGQWRPMLGNIDRDCAEKDEILLQTEVTTSPYNSELNWNFKVFYCQIIIVSQKTVQRFEITGNKLTPEVISGFKKLKSGDLIILHNVKGEPEPYNSVTQSLFDSVIEVLPD